MAMQYDVVYGTGNGRELCVDIFPATGTQNYRTAVLQLHGGRWRYGNRKMMADHARSLSALGFTCLPSEYRLLGEAPWPAALHDVKAAIRWTRANADRLDVDPNRIALQGCSAGAYLALMAAATNGRAEWEGHGGNAQVSSTINAIISIYPVTLFKQDWPGCYNGDAPIAASDGYLPASLLLEDKLTEEQVQAISPYSYVTPHFPSTALWHGGADTYVPPSHSIRMYEALVRAGVIADLHLIAGVAHVFDFAPSHLATVQHATALFLRRTISDPKAMQEEIAGVGTMLKTKVDEFNLPR
ncbi:MAG: alpha/beta hydrolase [Deltaproteobacteria bacterium]|nr:alpha/beta hydrolase [Deltaproteobacteria bacterium]